MFFSDAENSDHFPLCTIFNFKVECHGRSPELGYEVNRRNIWVAAHEVQCMNRLTCHDDDMIVMDLCESCF